MMATRLTDSELARRVRAGNRVRAQRQQERRRSAGLVQLNVWVSQSTRTALDRAAAHRNMTVSETVSDLLERALSVAMLMDATTTPASNDNTPVSSRDVLMAEVGKLLNEGLSGAEIARQLNASGQRTANGAEFTGGNLLRDYRSWSKKTGTPDIQSDSGA